jgi:hypothetical protein
MMNRLIMDWQTNALLRMVQLGVEDPSLDRMHHAIERELRTVSKQFRKAGAKASLEYQEALIDEGCERIEELLGMAFVVAQSFITTVRSGILKVSEICASNFGQALSVASGSRAYGTLQRGPKFGSGSHTAAEVINAIANYWKHHEDWPTVEQPQAGRIATRWDTNGMRGNEQKTVAIVTGIGLAYGSTGNLRTAADAFGVREPYENLSPVRDVLRSWAQDVYDETRRELTLLRTLPGQGDV